MSARTISHCQGKGSLSHDNRDFIPKNVDPERIRDNVTYMRQRIADAYEHCFSESVVRYNDKQTRTDRQIQKTYYEHLFNKPPQNSVVTSSNKQKSFYEDLVQIGTRDDTGVGTPEGVLAAKCLDEYMLGFSERNQNLYVFNAVMHLDEATPHLHIDYIPIGHYSRGLDTQNGLAQALKEMGYGGGKNAIDRWRQSERDVLVKICNSHGIEIKAPEQSRGFSLTSDEYKERKDAEKSAIEAEIQCLQNEKQGLERRIPKLQQKVAEAQQCVSKAQDDVFNLEHQKTALQDEIAPLRKLKRKIEDVESLAASAKVTPVGTFIRNETLNALTEKVKAYEVEMQSVMARERTATERETNADVRASSLDDRERKLERSKKYWDEAVEVHAAEIRQMRSEARVKGEELDKSLQAVRHLAGLPEKHIQLSKENQAFKNEVTELKAELTAKDGIISSLHEELANLKDKFDEMVETLTGKIRKAYEFLRCAVQAVGMLKYSNNSDYMVLGLTEKQGRLIDAIAEYGAIRADDNGHHDYAIDMRKSVKISEGMESEIKALENPAPQIVMRTNTEHVR